jgi:hypothetical protein
MTDVVVNETLERDCVNIVDTDCFGLGSGTGVSALGGAHMGCELTKPT